MQKRALRTAQQLATMSGAVLRVGGGKVAVERFLSKSRWRPASIFWKGKPRLEGSTRVSSVNGFNMAVSDAPGDRLDLQIRHAKRFLKRESVELRRLRRLGLEAILDFGVHARSDAAANFYRFDTDLLSRLVATGVVLEVSHYESAAVIDG